MLRLPSSPRLLQCFRRSWGLHSNWNPKIDLSLSQRKNLRYWIQSGIRTCHHRFPRHPQPLRPRWPTVHLRRASCRKRKFRHLCYLQLAWEIQSHPLCWHRASRASPNPHPICPLRIRDLVRRWHEDLQAVRGWGIQMFKIIASHQLDHLRPRHQLLHLHPLIHPSINCLNYHPAMLDKVLLWPTRRTNTTTIASRNTHRHPPKHQSMRNNWPRKLYNSTNCSPKGPPNWEPWKRTKWSICSAPNGCRTGRTMSGTIVLSVSSKKSPKKTKSTVGLIREKSIQTLVPLPTKSNKFTNCQRKWSNTAIWPKWLARNEPKMMTTSQ